MYQIRIEDMDLAQIAASGQCFRMKQQEDNSWLIRTKNHKLSAWQYGCDFTFSGSEEEFKQVWERYFDMGTDYRKIKALVDGKDDYLLKAIGYGSGIRVLNQDLWEMIVSFLISQNNNIPRIAKSIDMLCLALGEDGSFPEAEVIASAGVEKLAGLGLGYRDKYIAATARAVAEGTLDLNAMAMADYEEAHALLMKQFGIGKKVADCICLFGLHHVDAFPVDTHIKKILNENYSQGFSYERYKGYLGIIQQYMFYYDLKK